MTKVRKFFNWRAGILSPFLSQVLFLTCFLGFSFTAFSQNQIILKGKIIDEHSKEPLIGATIHVKRTLIGSLSDVNGEFQISVKQDLLWLAGYF